MSQQDPENVQLMKDMDKIWEYSGQYKKRYEPDTKAAWERFEKQLGTVDTQIRPGKRLTFTWMRAAAAVLLLVGSLWAWKVYTAPEIISTQANEMVTRQLPDGSTVQLNQQSKMHLVRFTATEREIYLQGEAFFQIKPDAAAPFYVKTSNAEVKVLGTSFNVRALDQESFTEVEVTEGKVQFAALNKTVAPVALNPQDRGVLNHSANRIEVLQDKNLNASSWHTGRLAFEGQPLGEILPLIARHYHIQIEVQQPSLLECHVTTSIQDQNAREALEAIAGIFIKPARVKADGASNFIIIDGSCGK